MEILHCLFVISGEIRILPAVQHTKETLPNANNIEHVSLFLEGKVAVFTQLSEGR